MEPVRSYNVDLLNPDDEYIEDNMYDYLMFYNWEYWNNFHECLCPDEMNYYLESTEDVFKVLLINEIEELADKVFISCDMIGDNYNLYGYKHIFHRSTNEYGEIVFTTNPSSAL
ncbi:MAG: hypothetical protein U5Q03_07445 [Bacteroidota bacterium]|nr:hypothetical protein [Bacteroidota bacterium]